MHLNKMLFIQMYFSTDHESNKFPPLNGGNSLFSLFVCGLKSFERGFHPVHEVSFVIFLSDADGNNDEHCKSFMFSSDL